MHAFSNASFAIAALVEALALPVVDITPYILVPSIQTRAGHHRRLTVASAALSNHLEQIIVLEKQLAAVRILLQQQFAAVKNAMTPITALPVETLQLIFKNAADGTCGYDNGIHTASALAQVCSQWRTVAISTPSLWSNMSFVETIRPRYPVGQLLSCAVRGAGVPRSLSVKDSKVWKWLRSLLKQDALREDLQSLSVATALSLCQFDFMGSAFPNLTNLSVQYDPLGDRASFGLDFPGHGILSPPLSPLSPSFNQFSTIHRLTPSLTTLCLTDVPLTTDDYWNLLNESYPCLEHLILRGCVWDGTLSPITMPNLRVLDIRMSEDSPGVTLPLQAPALRRLSFGCTYDDPLPRVLERYSPQWQHVESLEIHDLLQDAAHALADLTNAPSLFPNLCEISVFQQQSFLDNGLDRPHTYVKMANALKSLLLSPRGQYIKRILIPRDVVDCARPWFKAHGVEVVEQDAPECEW